MTRQSAACAAAIAILMPLGLASAPADAQTIAVFTKSQGNPVARSIRIGAETAARAEKILVFNFIPTSADNVPQQTALAEEALRSKPDAVVFTPTDSEGAGADRVRSSPPPGFRSSTSTTASLAATPPPMSAATTARSRARPRARCSRR